MGSFRNSRSYSAIPMNAEREIETTLAFIRKLKVINPAMEMVTYFYTPMPQRRTTYGSSIRWLGHQPSWKSGVRRNGSAG